MRGDRAVVDDPAATGTLFLHHLHSVPGAQERASEIDVDHLLPVRPGDLVDGARRAEHARVVDEQVEATPPPPDRLEQRRDGLRDAYLSRDGESGPGGRRGHGVLQFTLAAARGGDLPPRPEQRPRDAAAEARACPGDDRDSGQDGATDQDGTTDRPACATSMSWV
jgi:hypothetical protein